jgi:hypothetical protein
MNFPTKLLVAPFGVALAGLAWQLIQAPSLSEKILAIALLLLGLDQTRMAIVDCDHIQAVRAIADQPTADRAALEQFNRITLSTIGLELIGFYVALTAIGWGTIVVLASQIWFNLLARTKPEPTQQPPIQTWGWRDRIVVLVADTIGIGLAALWIAALNPLVMAIALCLMVLIYLGVKYLSPAMTNLFARGARDE